MKEIFLAYVKAINTSDLDAALALIAADATLVNSKYRPRVPAEGFELIKVYIEETVISQNGRISILKLEEKEGVIEAKIELRSDRISAAGFSRILGTEKFTIHASKIKKFEFTMNLEDAETQNFFDFVRNIELNRPQVN